MTAMANSKLLKVCAWPEQLLYETQRRTPVGFLMPRLVDVQPLQCLYDPVQRLKFFPRAGWKFQIRAALNLAATFDEVHAAACLVGDVNELNGLVSNQALVSLIDCDSFQVRANGKDYLCEVGVAQYTPPELQNKDLTGVVRTTNHDRYGLAVLIFQLLYVGKHPYAGVYQGSDDPSTEQLIAEYRFALSPNAASWQMKPPPFTPAFADILPAVGNLFRKAFERGSQNNGRPSASEWLSVLKRLEQDIAECPNESGHTFWRGCKSCPWCRVIAGGGPDYYFGVANRHETFAVNEAKLQDVLRKLAAVQWSERRYERRHYENPIRPVPEPIPAGFEDFRLMSLSLGGAALFGLLLVPFGLIHISIALIGLIFSSIFGVWFWIHRSNSPWQTEKKRRLRNRNKTLDELEDLEAEWFEIVRRHRKRHAECLKRVKALVAECRTLTGIQTSELQKVASNAEGLARNRHLQFHLIAGAKIPMIGEGLKQLLEQNGIICAVNLHRSAILQINGFGEKRADALMAWKQEVTNTFQFDPATAISPGEYKVIVEKLRHRERTLHAEIDRYVTDLQNINGQCNREIVKLGDDLRDALAESEQAEVDLQEIRSHK